jgi:hypothetical protein
MKFIHKSRLEKVAVGSVSDANYKTQSEVLRQYIWKGQYFKAIPLGEAVFRYLSKKGETERNRALVSLASLYYSFAGRLFANGEKALALRYLNKAREKARERFDIALSQEWPQSTEGLGKARVRGMSADELDVVQSVFRKSADVLEEVPLATRAAKTKNPRFIKQVHIARRLDATALYAIRAGVKETEKKGFSGGPHTNILLTYGSFSVARKYNRVASARLRANALLEKAVQYPWPSTEEINPKALSVYGQAARVAKCAMETAQYLNVEVSALEYEEKVQRYSNIVPDQKAKRVQESAH